MTHIKNIKTPDDIKQIHDWKTNCLEQHGQEVIDAIEVSVNLLCNFYSSNIDLLHTIIIFSELLCNVYIYCMLNISMLSISKLGLWTLMQDICSSILDLSITRPLGPIYFISTLLFSCSLFSACFLPMFLYLISFLLFPWPTVMDDTLA